MVLLHNRRHGQAIPRELKSGAIRRDRGHDRYGQLARRLNGPGRSLYGGCECVPGRVDADGDVGSEVQAGLSNITVQMLVSKQHVVWECRTEEMDVRVPVIEFRKSKIVVLGSDGTASVVCLHQIGCRAVGGPVDADAASGDAGVLRTWRSSCQ